MNPFGGQTGEGEGVIFALAFARDVVEAAFAAGMQTSTARRIAIAFLIAIPFELTDAEENADHEPDEKDR